MVDELFVPQNIGQRRRGSRPKEPPAPLLSKYTGEPVACVRCGAVKIKTHENFSPNITKKSGKKPWYGVNIVCRICLSKAALASTQKRRAAGWKPARDTRSSEYHRQKNLVKAYGITEEKFNELLMAQGGVCKICLGESRAVRQGKLRPLFVDHNHTTGKIRGLLCMNCNAGISQFRDDVEVIKSAIKYLEENDG